MNEGAQQERKIKNNREKNGERKMKNGSGVLRFSLSIFLSIVLYFLPYIFLSGWS
jgi:hypothetical protein